MWNAVQATIRIKRGRQEGDLAEARTLTVNEVLNVPDLPSRFPRKSYHSCDTQNVRQKFMDSGTRKILSTISTRKEITLEEALSISPKSHGNHLDQYPLALLLEEGYIGSTTKHTPPEGAEDSREYTQALTLHMFTLAKDDNGVTEYLGVKSYGSMLPEDEKVFIKAKGALHIDDLRSRRNERIISFILGLLAGALITLFRYLIA